MRINLFRIIGVILLLSIAMMFSGVTIIATVDSLAATGEINNHCNPDGAQGCPLPCATPVCSLCVCAVADVVQAVGIQTTFQAMEFEFPDISLSIPDPYVSEIFHPPKRENSIRRS